MWLTATSERESPDESALVSRVSIGVDAHASVAPLTVAYPLTSAQHPTVIQAQGSRAVASSVVSSELVGSLSPVADSTSGVRGDLDATQGGGGPQSHASWGTPSSSAGVVSSDRVAPKRVRPKPTTAEVQPFEVKASAIAGGETVTPVVTVPKRPTLAYPPELRPTSGRGNSSAAGKQTGSGSQAATSNQGPPASVLSGQPSDVGGIGPSTAPAPRAERASQARP